MGSATIIGIAHDQTARTVAIVIGCFLLIASAAAAPASGAQRAEIQPESHCVLNIEDGIPREVGCFDSLRQAQLSVNESPGAAVGSAASSFVLGTYFSGQNFTGSSITITGSGCSFLIWKPTGSWDNNIESAYHYCGSVPARFYNSSSCSGSSKAVRASVATLAWMNNLSSCVRYG